MENKERGKSLLTHRDIPLQGEIPLSIFVSSIKRIIMKRFLLSLALVMIGVCAVCAKSKIITPSINVKGTVIRDYGEEHMKTGDLIVYTSADSVFQIAAHESIVPVEKLYEYCEIAREILQGEHGVGRVIARPFEGEPGNFKRTSRRHDYSLQPPKTTMLDVLKEKGYDVWSVGKIIDIFAEKGITEYVRTANNEEGINQTISLMKKDFNGLMFVNLVDYDMLYGHRNDVDGYAKALTYFDERLPEILAQLREKDILMITADHGCDPITPSTDHSREYTPLLMVGKPIEAGVNYGTRDSFADIAATILNYFGITKENTADFPAGESLIEF